MHSEFKTIFSDPKGSDAVYRFLQVVYHLYPEDKFHYLLSSITKQEETDESIYTTAQKRLKVIKPFLSELTYALPALATQKRELTTQALTLLGSSSKFNGYLEIGSTGRYISALRKKLTISGDTILSNDIAPSNSIADIAERGQIKPIGRFIPLRDYQPFSEQEISSGSIDLITCYIGLHHCPPEKLEGYIASLYRILRSGGALLLRDHNVTTEAMNTFVSLIHTIFNLGLGVPWSENAVELRHFHSIEYWAEALSAAGFSVGPQRLLQQNDPSDNTLIICRKP